MRQLVPLLAAAALLGGCQRLFDRPVPEFATAREQYRYAEDLVQQTDPLPERRESNAFTREDSPYYEPPRTRYRERDYRRFVQAFETVATRFPGDTEFTPNAKVRVAELQFLLEDYGLSASAYRDVLESYPDDEVLQSASLFGLAQVALARHQYSEAQRFFRELISRHGRSQNDAIAELVQRAQLRLQQLQYQLQR